MEDDEVLWDYDPHTLAKHQILKAYLNAWAPIMLQGRERRILYLDGFAGPGESKDKKHLGSPILALDLITAHRALPKFKGEIVMHFIEIEPKRATHLSELIKSRFFALPQAVKYDVINDEFCKKLREILTKVHENGGALAPTFCFVDPFGWSDIDVDLLADLMLEDKAELFITFVVGFIKRFVTDEKSGRSFAKIFTGTQMDQIKTAGSDQEKEHMIMEFFVKNIKAAIKNKGKAHEIYDISFAAVGKNNTLTYYLIYFTSHPKGLKVMKEAMFAIGKDGSYRFSDFEFNPKQSKIVDYTEGKEWQIEAAKDVYGGLKGKTLRVREIDSYVLTNTNWIFRKEILKKLEEQGKIVCANKSKKKYTYSDEEELIQFK